jgi:hypothetical protein
VRENPGVHAGVRLTGVILFAAALMAPAAPPPGFPPDLDAYFTKYVKLDANARAQLLAGVPVTKMLDSDASKEVAIFGAMWVNAPLERYLEAVREIERFESGGAFRVTRKVTRPPTLEDFAQLSLSDDDVKDLRSCRVAQCEFKLSSSAIERMRREIDWTRPDVREQANRLARQMAFEYVTEYLKGGNAELAVYRDADRPTFVSKEFEELVNQLPELNEFVPRLRRYLLDFPNATLPGSESFVYWQDADFGLKPTIRINHLVIAEDDSGAIVASKMLYATHYFWTALELRVLVRDPHRGPGFWFVTESRSRSDGLSGFVGHVIRGKVRGGAEKGTVAQLHAIKSRLE